MTKLERHLYIKTILKCGGLYIDSKKYNIYYIENYFIAGVFNKDVVYDKMYKFGYFCKKTLSVGCIKLNNNNNNTPNEIKTRSIFTSINTCSELIQDINTFYNYCDENFK